MDLTVVQELHADPPEGFAAGPVVLRAMREEDWPLEQALSRDPDVLRWTTHPAHLDEATARQRMRDVADRALRRLGQRYVVCTPDGEPAGMVALTVERSPEPSVGYALLPAGRGRGMAATAVRLLTEWAHSVGHPCVSLMMLSDNAASAGVAARAGFRMTGAQRSARPDGTSVELLRWESRA